MQLMRASLRWNTLAAPSATTAQALTRARISDRSPSTHVILTHHVTHTSACRLPSVARHVCLEAGCRKLPHFSQTLAAGSTPTLFLRHLHLSRQFPSPTRNVLSPRRALRRLSDLPLVRPSSACARRWLMYCQADIPLVAHFYACEHHSICFYSLSLSNL